MRTGSVGSGVFQFGCGRLSGGGGKRNCCLFWTGNSLRYPQDRLVGLAREPSGCDRGRRSSLNYDPSSPTLDLEASNYASSFAPRLPRRHVPDLCGLVAAKITPPALGSLTP